MALVPVGVVDKARDGAKQFARGFTPGQKAVTIAAIVAIAIGSFFFMSVSGKPTYAPLFTNLAASDAASITSQLSSAKIPYQLADGGATIMIPTGDVSQERLTLAQAGLPASSNSGLSILDKEGITTSNITQQADYLRALQGELDQTLDSISGVASATVNIALPADQNFALSNNSPTGASVMVAMQTGQTLSSGEVQAIVHLVGSSVPGLNSDDVTVADSSGDLLAGPGVTAGSAGGDSSTNSYDAEIESKVDAYLASVVGAGNSDVQVNALLDFSQVQTTTNSIIPGPKGTPVSFCTSTSGTKETYSGTGTPTGGAAGTITNTSSSGTGTYSNTSNTSTCETSEQTQTVDQAPGTLKSEQVAVLVNSKAIPAGTNLQALKAGVAAAAGISAPRGDQLAFSSMPFTTAASQQAAAAAKAAAAQSQQQSMYSLVKTAVIMFIIALTLFLLWRSARKAKSSMPSILSTNEIEALRSRTMANSLPPMPAVAEISATQEAAQVNHFIDSQPEDVANMLRGWINSSDSKAAV